ncbi:ParA family protein [Fluviibacter phosphoraccumulans]|uniref:Chromosome partitioning protein Soj n=1 Tax=Fluviibacter phosphoraccumulans TaxID=1751046 RepID=A0A7R6QX62_9RHOO|nr:ParA family protein [Fluviibacter phosphoraccumulans]BBU68726.1 chromosome partitioning protein Soj [Fluviibacter phosphoraccumulans]BBU72121.1 chromosome partitioning protein Soj [Fluviibacter phosphoraccumulans]
MKTLLISINKGGVGKTTLVSQLGRYAHQLGLRTLLIDLDDQGNLTRSLERQGSATRLRRTVTEILFEPVNDADLGYTAFSILAADGGLTKAVVETSQLKATHQGVERERATIAHQHFAEFLKQASAHYDLCLIDGPPALDVRVMMALALADYALCPIQLAQESIEGMSHTLNGPRGILRIKGTVNNRLEFLGFLPNMVESTVRQKEALLQLGEKLGHHFLRDDEGRVVLIPLRQSIRDAQGQGISLAALAKTNTQARDTWGKVRRIFDQVLDRMELRSKIEAIHEQRLEALRIEKAQQRLARICEPESALQDDLAVMDEAVREEASHV